MRSTAAPEADLESLRKTAQILVIDDMAFPSQKLFERDGYHIQRRPRVKNLSQLTDGYFDVILLDVQGVGLDESPDLQGLGILQAIKRVNPAQVVILYSAGSWRLTTRSYTALADEVLDKEASYIDYKDVVDRLLLRRASPGYYVAVMNGVLGSSAASARAVAKALRALRSGNSEPLRRYLVSRLKDKDEIDRVLTVVSIGATALQLAGVGG